MIEPANSKIVTVVPTILPAPAIRIDEMPEGYFWTRDGETIGARDRLIDMEVPGIHFWMDWKRVLN